MEEWFAAGGLSQEDFELLVKLAARYVYWDVDQFDHWELPTPGGSMFVDFNQSGPTPYGEDPTAYRVLWPSLAVSERGWTVWREDDEGARPGHLRRGSPRTSAGRPMEARATASLGPSSVAGRGRLTRRVPDEPRMEPGTLISLAVLVLILTPALRDLLRGE